MKILPDEKIIYKKRGSFKAFFDCIGYSRKHKKVSSVWKFWFIRMGVLCLVFAMWKEYIMNSSYLIGNNGSDMFFVTLFLVISMLYWLCKAKSSLIIITNKRMLIKTGIIFQDSTITDLRRVATIDIKQSIVGSMIGCGALVFHGYGIGGFCLPFMSRPAALRDEILKAQSGITDDGQKIDDDVLDEY